MCYEIMNFEFMKIMKTMAAHTRLTQQALASDPHQKAALWCDNSGRVLSAAAEERCEVPQVKQVLAPGKEQSPLLLNNRHSAEVAVFPHHLQSDGVNHKPVS